MRRTGVVVVLLALLGTLTAAGCAAASDQAAPGGAATAPIEAMTPSAKRAAIDTGFPAEVPVPVGDFTRAQAQGDDAWDYTVEVATTLEELAGWYRAAYVGRQWVTVGEEPIADGEEQGVTLRFRKGNAESSVTVSQSDNGGPVRASVTLGVGAPVLLTQ